MKTNEDFDFVDVESCAIPDGESPPSKKRVRNKKKEPATLEEGSRVYQFNWKRI